MRFGISATSMPLPKNLRMRLRLATVWVSAMWFPCKSCNSIIDSLPEPRLAGIGQAVAKNSNWSGGAPEGAPPGNALLQLDLGASRLELLLHGLGVGLVDAFLHGLGRALDQILGFLEAEAGDGPDFLDHFDLLVAGGGEHDRELGLLFHRSSGGGTARSGNRHGSRSGNAPLLF